MITQVFVLGSSLPYGVGASHAGWGDLIKQYAHAKMYGKSGVGQKYEVFNFGKADAKIDFVKETFPQQLHDYGRKQKVVVVIAIGGNNTKAEGSPDNFVSTPEEYEHEMKDLLTLLVQYSDAVIVVDNGYIDESKTNPKVNPLTGGTSYFSNARRQQFSAITKQLCKEKGIDYAQVAVGEQEWIKNYLYSDGVHPNQQGHQLVFESIKPLLNKYL